MAIVRNFEDLGVWQEAHKLVLALYQATRAFPREELYGLTPQLRRAAVSIPANIAEGHQRRGKAEYSRLVSIADGSLSEVKYYLILARDLGYLNAGAYDGLRSHADLVGRLIGGLLRSLGRA